MADRCFGKDSWPELVGVHGYAAKLKVQTENRNVKAIVVMEGNAVIMDYRCTRVWIWVDTKGYVTRVPVVG